MPEHIHQWLSAYHDGELRGARLRQVENHLTECAACQAELDEMRSLSTLLKETAIAEGFLSTEQFAANLALRLPRQPKTPRFRSKSLEIGWWLVPFGALGMGLFIEVTFAIRSAVLFAADAGLLGREMTWMQGVPLQMDWFTTAMNLFGHQVSPAVQTTLSALNDAHLFVTQVTGSLLPQVLFSVIYFGWVAVWWLSRLSQPTGSFSQS